MNTVKTDTTEYTKLVNLKPIFIKKINQINSRLPQDLQTKNINKVAKINQTMNHYYFRYDLKSKKAKKWQKLHKQYGALIHDELVAMKLNKLANGNKSHQLAEYIEDRFGPRVFIGSSAKYDYLYHYGKAQIWHSKQIMNYCNKVIKSLNPKSEKVSTYREILKLVKASKHDVQSLDIDIKYLGKLTTNGDVYFYGTTENGLLDYEKHLYKINPKLALKQMSEIAVSNLDYIEFCVAENNHVFTEWQMPQVTKYAKSMMNKSVNPRTKELYKMVYDYSSHAYQDTFSYDYPIKHIENYSNQIQDEQDVSALIDASFVSSNCVKKPVLEYAHKIGLDKAKTMADVAKIISAKKYLSDFATD